MKYIFKRKIIMAVMVTTSLITTIHSQKFDLGLYAGFKSVTSKVDSVFNTSSAMPIGGFFHYIIPMGSFAAGIGAFTEYSNFDDEFFSLFSKHGLLTSGIDGKLVFVDQGNLMLYGRAGLGLLSSKGDLLSVGGSYHLLVGAGVKNLVKNLTFMFEGGMTGGSISSISNFGIQFNLGLIIPLGSN